MNKQFEMEEEHLVRMFNDGLISQAEYNKAMRDLQREWREEARAAAEEAAERAYRDEMDRW